MIHNIIVSLSNLSGFYFFNFSLDFYIFPMLASILYHLSETKHNLPGIYPFNNYTFYLLQLDRIFAVISFLLIMNKLNFHIFILGIIGFLFLFLSEQDTILNKIGFNIELNVWIFTITHCLWHIIAFYCLSKIN